ncbi:MAG TPA: LOG family protein, partial [Terriglobales bacterium]
GILNVNGYYDPLLELFQKSVAEGFLRKEHADMLMVESDPEKLLQQFATYNPPQIEKWITRDEA